MKRFLLAAVLVGVGFALCRLTTPGRRPRPPVPDTILVVEPADRPEHTRVTRLRVVRAVDRDGVRVLADHPGGPGWNVTLGAGDAAVTFHGVVTP